MTSHERGTLITMCLAVNATGNVVPPMLVFPRINYRDYFIRDGPPCCVGVANKSGWMIAEHFMEFMKHFVKHVRPSKDSPVLLLLDNHESHLGFNIINYAKENGVIFLSFPPHCSHKLQPLDRSVYGPLKKAISTEQDNWMRNHLGQTITIYDLPGILREALPRVATYQNIVKGFSAAGICPFNLNIFTDTEFAPSYVTDRPYEKPVTDDMIQPEACSEVGEDTGARTNTNAVSSSGLDGWELISRYLETKVMTMENVPGDGHCLLYAVIRSLEAQGTNNLSVEKLCALLLDEVQNNIPFYEEFGTNRQDIINELNRYVTEKQYNNDTGDIIMAALCNALLVTTTVTLASGSTVIQVSQTPGRPGLAVDRVSTVHVALHNGHYRAAVPILHDIQADNEISDNRGASSTDETGPTLSEQTSAVPSEQTTVETSEERHSVEAQNDRTNAPPFSNDDVGNPDDNTTTVDQAMSTPAQKKSGIIQNDSVPEATSSTTEPPPKFTPHTVRPFPKAGERKLTKSVSKKKKDSYFDRYARKTSS